MADIVVDGIRRHATFEVAQHCVVYPTEASSASRRLFTQEWRTKLLHTIQQRQIDCNVVDKFVSMLGQLNFVYDPMENIMNNVLGRQALDAMAPIVSMRNHAARHGLPGIPAQLLEAFSNGGVLPAGVRGTMQDRVQNFDRNFRRGGAGGGLTGVAQQIGAMRRCLGPTVGGRVIPSTPEQVVAIWGPIVRTLLTLRGLSMLPMGKVRLPGSPSRRLF